MDFGRLVVAMATPFKPDQSIDLDRAAELAKDRAKRQEKRREAEREARLRQALGLLGPSLAPDPTRLEASAVEMLALGRFAERHQFMGWDSIEEMEASLRRRGSRRLHGRCPRQLRNVDLVLVPVDIDAYGLRRHRFGGGTGGARGAPRRVRARRARHGAPAATRLHSAAS